MYGLVVAIDEIADVQQVGAHPILSPHMSNQSLATTVS